MIVKNIVINTEILLLQQLPLPSDYHSSSNRQRILAILNKNQHKQGFKHTPSYTLSTQSYFCHKEIKHIEKNINIS